MYICNRCKKEFSEYSSLSKHTSRLHKIDSITFYVEYNLDNKWPTCKCGCGSKLKWSYQLKGFREFVAGHQSRIHSNFSNNPKAIKNSIKTRRIRFASGEITTWNKGLTKETDNRVKNNGIESAKS